MKWARLDLPWWSIHTFASSVICWAGHSIQSINPSIQGFVTTFQQLFFSIQITDIKNMAWGVYSVCFNWILHIFGGFTLSQRSNLWPKSWILMKSRKRQNKQKLKLFACKWSKLWNHFWTILHKSMHIFTTNLTLFAWQHQVSSGSNSLSNRKMNAKRFGADKEKGNCKD